MAEPLLAMTVGNPGAEPAVHFRSAVAWPAIIAGAFVAAATSLILIALGSGLGFASISPWRNAGVTTTTFTITAVIWLIVTQWLSACVGGYIAGRLRTRWVGTHTHEVFFRDTAHGFITWAVSTVMIAGTLSTALFSAAGSGVHAASAAAVGEEKGAMTNATAPGASYEVDRLFRAADGAKMQDSANANVGRANAGRDLRSEVMGIVANAVVAGSMPEADRTYLTQLVVANTGVSAGDAQKRVDDFRASVANAEDLAKAAADVARKAAAELSIYVSLSLLIGAFIASVSAALGGRLRDEHL